HRLNCVLENFSQLVLHSHFKENNLYTLLVSYRFLVPRDMSVGQFIHILSSRLHLTPGKALFVFVKNTLPQTASRMDSIYENYTEDDGFLYMCYSSEKTFG
ncbi:autophagy-related protein 8i-like, partial [Prunus avium]|uniref:Autophagy-related protein n=1 Tax=Prunus avium TaxID=42229 RepID=A0A6P5S4J9_PRUAV